MGSPPAGADRDAWCGAVRAIGARLHSALAGFAMEAGLANTLERLEQVWTVSDDAAHRTIDLVELCLPLAEQTAGSAAAILAQWRAERDAQPVSAHAVESFLDQTRRNMSTVTASLSEALLAYSGQEQGGKVIRAVIKLLGPLEAALIDLNRLAGASDATAAQPAGASGKRRSDLPRSRMGT